MKKSLLLPALVAALAVSACGTKDEKAKPAPADTAQKAAMATEYQALPAGAVVRVPLDANGNETKDAAEVRFVDKDVSKSDEGAVSTAFDRGQTSDKGGWNVAMSQTETLDGTSGLGNDSYGNTSYGNNSYGYDANNNGYYDSYRPRLFSRIVRGAAWILTRPIVWTVGAFRYYSYNRPDCGCYAYDNTGGNTYGGKQTTYVDVNVGGKNGNQPQPYAPTQQPYTAPVQPYVAPAQPYVAPQQPYATTQQQLPYAPQSQPYYGNNGKVPYQGPAQGQVVDSGKGDGKKVL